jgi:hypothetical protein
MSAAVPLLGLEVQESPEPGPGADEVVEVVVVEGEASAARRSHGLATWRRRGRGLLDLA